MKYATYPILPTRPILAMKPIMLFFLMACMAFTTARAGRISGTVTDDKGALLAYSSVFVKGTTKGVTANNEGKYSLELDPGNYTLVCQYVGYTRQEKKISVEAGQGTSVVDFRLSLQQLSLGEVVVRPGGEDPAYEIIRHAIKKRKDYEFPLDSFTCEAYIKTLAKTRGLPGRILGQKITGNDKKDAGLDSAGKGIIFLSESLTKIAYKKPGKVKLEVLSGRQSGSNGYGFSFPTFINFYNNNVTVLGSELNPRGFISPIAESALHYYKYKYLGSFFEDGKEINKIQVIPRRKYEPLFTGTINIMEGEWRIHSLDLTLLKESQLEILDTLQIRQIQVPVGGGVWQTKDQVVYFAFKLLGIDMVGNFLDVFSKYETAPQFRKKFFNNVLVRYDTAVNKKTKAYWDSIRPLPLEPEEKQCIKGIIINKFRGDPALFEGGRAQLEELCQVPVVGVLPFSRDIFIEEEDSVALKQKHSGLMGGLAGWPAARKVNIAVVLLHRLSNFTDFNRLERDPRVNLFYTRDANEIGKADIVILPGSKNTIGDLLALKNNGMAEAVRKAAEDQRTVIGICGGYQMMGEWVEDPLHVETGIEHISGLGLLPVGTVMGMEKTTRQCSFRFQDRPEICEGYEIHMGESVVLTEERPLNHFPDGSTDGYFLHDKCWGTYLHGLFDNPVIIDRLLAPYTDLPGEDFDYRQYKEDQYDRLAGLIRQHIDMGNIYKTLQF